MIRFYFAENKSVIITILIAVGIGSLIYFTLYSSTKEPAFIESFDKETKGAVYSLNEKTTTTQGFDGASTIIFAYEISYSFVVDSVTYLGKIILANKTGNLKHLYYIRENLNRQVFTIKYLSADPEENYLIYSSE